MARAHSPAREEKIEVGREAAIVESIARAYITEYQLTTVQRLVTIYRSGKLDHDQLVGMVGGLAALQDLLAHLESDRSQGDRAAQEEYSNGT